MHKIIDNDSFKKELQNKYKPTETENIFLAEEGYWSNLNREENVRLISALEKMSTREAIKKYHTWLYDVIFSAKRLAGLELLELTGNEKCVDYGCMWGALTIPLARRCKHVLGVDKTLDSLRFLARRAAEESLDNVDLLCNDLKKLDVLDNKFDVAVVNGVLEWVPEFVEIELKKFQDSPDSITERPNPYNIQTRFLKTVYENLNDTGKLYLAIENRYDYRMFLGEKDPHSTVLFTSVLPRRLADIICKMKLNRPYVTWTYSFRALEKLLHEIGFSKTTLHCCFPDYRFPNQIIPFASSLKHYKSIRKKSAPRDKIIKAVETVLFKHLELKLLSPSIIAIAEK